jgi:DNA-binding HxlR family transcriptional regulator
MNQLYQTQAVELRSIELLGEKWTLKLLGVLAGGPSRFSTLQHGLGMSSKTLSKRLKQLEQHGLITKTIYAQVPLRVEYDLTHKGDELVSILASLSQWEKKWQ